MARRRARDEENGRGSLDGLHADSPWQTTDFTCTPEESLAELERVLGTTFSGDASERQAAISTVMLLRDWVAMMRAPSEDGTTSEHSEGGTAQGYSASAAVYVASGSGATWSSFSLTAALTGDTPILFPTADLHNSFHGSALKVGNFGMPMRNMYVGVEDVALGAFGAAMLANSGSRRPELLPTRVAFRRTERAQRNSTFFVEDENFERDGSAFQVAPGLGAAAFCKAERAVKKLLVSGNGSESRRNKLAIAEYVAASLFFSNTVTRTKHLLEKAFAPGRFAETDERFNVDWKHLRFRNQTNLGAFMELTQPEMAWWSGSIPSLDSDSVSGVDVDVDAERGRVVRRGAELLLSGASLPVTTCKSGDGGEFMLPVAMQEIVRNTTAAHGGDRASDSNLQSLARLLQDVLDCDRDQWGYGLQHGAVTSTTGWWEPPFAGFRALRYAVKHVLASDEWGFFTADEDEDHDPPTDPVPDKSEL